MSSEGNLQGRPVSDRSSDPSDVSKFEAKVVLHLVYSNAESANHAGHRQHGYITATISDKRWFSSKDAFMAAMCKAFDKVWEEMKIGGQ